MRQYIIGVIVISFLSLFVFTHLEAQTDKSLGDITIGVVCPNEIEGLSTSSISMLKTKIESIVSANGITASESKVFVLYPVFELYDKSVVEGGMKKITVSKIGVTLFVKELGSNMVINSFTVELKGSGFSSSESFVNAISSINPNDLGYKGFLDESKKRILSFYQKECNKIIETAKTLASVEQFEAALAALVDFPESLPMFTTAIYPVIIDIYKQYQDYICVRQLQEANGLLVKRDVSSAIDALLGISPSSRCFTESLKVLDSIQKVSIKTDSLKIADELKERILLARADSVKFANEYKLRQLELTSTSVASNGTSSTGSAVGTTNSVVSSTATTSDATVSSQNSADASTTTASGNDTEDLFLSKAKDVVSDYLDTNQTDYNSIMAE